MAAGRAARTVAWITGNVLGDWAVQSGWLARAQPSSRRPARTGPSDGWVLIIKAFSEPDAKTREALLREAIAIGRRFGDPDIEFEALAYLGGLFVMTDRVEEGLVFFDEALAAVCAGELTELATVDGIFCGFFWACELVNDVPRADQWMRAAADLMKRSNVVAAFCRAHYGGILTAAGRWNEAETELVEAARHFDRGLSSRRDAAIIRLADLRVRQGRLEEAAQLLEGLEQHPDAVRTLAALHLARGDTALARDLLERATQGPDDEVPDGRRVDHGRAAARPARRRPPRGGRPRRRRPGRSAPGPHRRGAAGPVPQGRRRARQGAGLRRQRARGRARLPARGARGVRAGAAADGARADAPGDGARAVGTLARGRRSPRRRRRWRSSSGWRRPGTPTPPARCCGRSARPSGPAPRGSAR